MPMYEYKCTTCNFEWEQQRDVEARNFDLNCPTCGNGYVVRVFHGAAIAIEFKTGGFYSTDNQKGTK